RRSIAEELPQRLFMKSNPMLLHQRYEIFGHVARQGRSRKMRVRRNEVLRRAMNVGEVAAPAAGNQDLLADPLGPLQHRHTTPPLTRLDGAHEPGSTGAENDDVKILSHE